MPLKVVPRRDRKLNRLVKKGSALTLVRGESLFEEGTLAKDVYLVRSGLLCLVVGEGTLQERTVGLAGASELVGTEAIVPGGRRRASARASERTEVTMLEGRSVRRTLQTSERTLEAYLGAVDQDLALARRLGHPRRSTSAAFRLAAVLNHLFARWSRSDGGERSLPVRLTHQILADLAGIHRSTVTTLVNDWIYVGVLALQEGRLRLLRPEDLPER